MLGRTSRTEIRRRIYWRELPAQARRFGVTEVSFIDTPPDGAFRARVRIRHHAEPVAGEVRPREAGTWTVELDEAAWAPAPGQAAVFYDEHDAVIGGGRIDQPAAAA